MFQIDALLFKVIVFWGAAAAILMDAMVCFMAWAWLDDWHKDRADTQAKVLFWVTITSAVLITLFLACQSGIIKPMGLQ